MCGSQHHPPRMGEAPLLRWSPRFPGMTRRIQFIDVFGDEAIAGNPLAVVVDSEGLTDEQMLETARWLNLSETTFLLPPTREGADYAVRIFTISGELPFAGHPTLGTCHVWRGLQGSGQDQVVQECGAGFVRLENHGGQLFFEVPPLVRSGPVDHTQLEEFADVLRVRVEDVVDSNWVDNGPGWVGIQLKDAHAVLDLQPDFARHSDPDSLFIGVLGFHAPAEEALYEVRAFFPDQAGRMLEDPVTGSLNAALAQWLVSDGKANPPYMATQGTAMGRSGRIHISRDESGSLWVGGSTVTIIEGLIDI